MNNLDFLSYPFILKRLYGRMFDPIVRQYGLTQMEMDILLFLANNPPYDTARDIVSKRGLTKSHVSASIESLAQRGYLQREHRDNNNKTVHLTLLPKAVEPVEAGRGVQLAFFKELLKGIPPEDVDTLARLMDTIRCNAMEATQKYERGTS